MSGQSDSTLSDQQSSEAHSNGRPEAPPPQTPNRPWRAEGLPEGQDDDNQPKRPGWKRVLAWVLGGYLVFYLLVSLRDGVGGPPTVSYTEFTDQVAAGNVAEVFARGDSIQGELTQAADIPGEDGTYEQFTTERPTFAEDNLMAQLENRGATVSATPVVEERGAFWNLLIAFPPLLLLIGFWYWIFKRQQKMAGGGMGGLFGGGKKREPVNPESVRTTFDDVAGIDEVKEQVNEVVDYLRDSDKYRKLGARAPKGVLLAGEPGTGKTLLARATAGEAGVPFFSASASEFIEMVVGVGASRVRELFTEARKNAPSIIFIDELDTIGRARGGSGSVGGHDERADAEPDLDGDGWLLRL